MSHTALSELIEHERTELMQVHAMVRCLNDVLLYSDDDDSSMHADVALVIARLLNESVGRLEMVRVRVAELEQPATPPNQVRDTGAIYLVSRAPALHHHDIRSAALSGAFPIDTCHPAGNSARVRYRLRRTRGSNPANPTSLA